MHPWVQYQIRRIEVDELHAQTARERLLASARIEAQEGQTARPLSRLDRALAQLGGLLTRLGRRLEDRARPIPKATRPEVCT